MPHDSNCSAAAVSRKLRRLVSRERRSPLRNGGAVETRPGPLPELASRLPAAGRLRNVGSGGPSSPLHSCALDRQKIARTRQPGLREDPAQPADVLRRQDRIWSRPGYTTSGSPGSANSRSAPGFWNSALFAYCLRGCGKHGWRQTALHSPRISVCELNQHKVKGNSAVSTIVLAACGSPF